MFITPDQFKTINQQTLDDLILFKTEEDIHLEYKKKLISNEKIAKALCALANTEGGNVIFGMGEDKSKATEIIPIITPKAQEKIDQIARTGISPPLHIRIQPIEVNVKGVQGQVVVVYVPKKYPYIHFAKKTYKFYKRSEGNSIPMEEYEIREAYRLQNEYSNIALDNAYDSEKLLRKKIGVHRLDVILMVWPSLFGPNLFSIGEDMTEFFENNRIEVIPYEFLYLFFPDTRDSRNQIGQDYYFFKPDFQHLSTALFKTNGVSIYNLQFNIAKRDDEKEIIKKDYLRTGKFGLVDENDKVIKLDLIAFCVLAYLSFMQKFYTAINYWGGINIIFDINNIEIWHDKYGRSFSDLQFTPVELCTEVFELSIGNLEILKRLFNSLLNGYGWSEHKKKIFFQNLEIELEKTSD